MSIPYTPTPNPLPATITLPQDVIDDVVVGTVNPQVAQVADAVLYERESVDGCYLRASITDGTYTGVRFPLVISLPAGNLISIVSGDKFHVDEAGYYFASFQLLVTIDSATPGLTATIALTAIGPNQPMVIGAAFRASGDTGDVMVIQGSGMFAANAGDEFALLPAAGLSSTDITVLSGPAVLNTISVFRVK